MKLAKDWFKSKMLLTAVLPAVMVAVDGLASGQMKPLHAGLTVAGALGAFALRDTIAKHKEETALVSDLLGALLHQNNEHQDQRMGTLNGVAQVQREAAAEVAGHAQTFLTAAKLLKDAHDALGTEANGEV